MKKSFIILLVAIVIAALILFFVGNKENVKNEVKNKQLPKLENTKVPNVVFKTKKEDIPGEKCVGDANLTNTPSSKIFENKKIVLFALPGAFTPTCSSKHLPGYEKHYDEFKKLGVDEVYSLAVNDPYVMSAWAKDLEIEKVKMLPDGNAEFTEKIGMLVDKSNIGFGKRSWRYSMYVENGEIKKVFAEEGFKNNNTEDPFEVSDAETMLEYLKENK